MDFPYIDSKKENTENTVFHIKEWTNLSQIRLKLPYAVFSRGFGSVQR
jgi:hypothetical protein